MFKLFAKPKRLVQQIQMATRDTNDVVADIHNDFDTASERLLNEAKKILAKKIDTEKGNRLASIGFTSSREAVESEAALSIKRNKEKLASHIEYYQQRYPNNKFINQETVEAICKKYGLLHSQVSNYIGEVPIKNLVEIERFVLQDSEKTKIEYSHFVPIRDDSGGSMRVVGKKTKTSLYGYHQWKRNTGTCFYEKPETETHHFESQEMTICASKKDFDLSNMYVGKDGYSLLDIPDPIVLQPVNGGYLIISKWGLEGNDEALVNEKMN